MPITPTGAPAWLRANTHVEYGGDLNKRNFLSQGVIDPQTDVGADQFSRIVADMEALSRTCPFAIFTFRNNDTSPAAPLVQSVFMMPGVRKTSYAGDAAPSGFVSGARNGTGDATFTFQNSYFDAYGVEGGFVVSHVLVAALSGATYCKATYSVPTDNTLRVKCFNAAGAALGDQSVSVTVW